MNIVIVLDTSSGANWDDIEGMKVLINNFVKTLNVSDNRVQYSLVTYGETGKVVVSFKESTEEDFNVEGVKIEKIGGGRDIEEALKLVDKNVFGRTTAGFSRNVVNGIVYVFTPGEDDNRVKVRINLDHLSSTVNRLLQRNIETVFVDAMGGSVIDGPLAHVITNMSTENPRTLPSLLSKLSTHVGKIQGKIHGV